MLAVIASLVACAMAQESATEAQVAVTQSANSFSNDLFKKIAKEQVGKNLISSPLSADIVLSMAAYGAGGNTAKQMRQSLHLPENDAVARQGFESLLTSLQDVKNVTLKIANKVYVAKGFEVKAEYKQLTSGPFKSETSELDLEKPTESAASVNKWVEDNTNNKIHEIVRADDINTDTRLLLLNAVYFKGNWAKKFNEKFTEIMPFNTDEKTQKNVSTMFMSSKFKYGELPNLKAKFVELPYENKDLKMIIILPDEVNGLSLIEENLESVRPEQLKGEEVTVELYLPKFKIESTIDLEKPLKELGMTDMFENSANFTGMSDAPLKVGKVLQKAFIEVNEEGSEAAAVTAIQIVPLNLPSDWDEEIIFKVDRPFSYKIIDTATQAVLFTGHVYDPTN
ncbi:hypothetical protein QAD02_017625 [Eretmocerus hayati]|uniref:Uncharacterized protein n=1 Tax=Eretmocerus hayati TaxID=131215 RepID=A0ACC2PED5_9HYME|nr:hypothetical protein QAD02_017625 [Eretmocerus hayati]